MEKALIYAVDDEQHIRELIEYNLLREGYQVKTFPDGEAFLDQVAQKVPSLCILDIMLPGASGLELCTRLRFCKETANLPVILLTAKNEEVDKVLGLEIGADDYITKPFSVRELSARVKALLRRSAAKSEQAVIEIGDISLNTETRRVTRAGEEIILTYKEFELLKLLMQNKDKVLTRETLLDKIWGYDFVGESRTIDVHIRNLRKLIGDTDEGYIETSRGVGYRFCGPKA